MRTLKTRNIVKKVSIAMLLPAFLLIMPIAVYASSPPPARAQTAPEQQLWNWSFEFQSGMDFQTDLGRPTGWNGQVQPNPFTANVRRDANISLQAPPARGGSTIQTQQVADFRFRNQQNSLQQSGFWNPVQNYNPHALPNFDLGQQGVNAPIQATPQLTNTAPQAHPFQNTPGGGGFLPSTSI
ncbi:MAG: hypothetical protein FWG63_11445 [Defluviitaleaceae bacterium]|nr:hypothetical protein [Defluviitaleaceae bacterium]